MTGIMVPTNDPGSWPTLGPQVCRFIEENLVFGPGDLRGESVVLDDEKRFFVYRLYEVYPELDDNGEPHPQAGRRRFERACLSLPKGSAKTEFAALIAACELHHEAPVRCDGFDKQGRPMGRPVTDPYIPMIAYAEEQVERLAYGALKTILEESPIASDFDIGLERIVRLRGDGRAEALSTSPNAADGDRTTFQHFDETHRFTLPRLKDAYRVMLANMTKRQQADGWSLETTTAPEPGARSVAEGTMEYAKAVQEGRSKPRNFFFFHRQAGGDGPLDLTQETVVRTALEDAYGPLAAWQNMEAKVNLWADPQYPIEEFERFFLNRMVKSSSKAFDPVQWAKLAKADYKIPEGALITLGFDGAMFHDATGLVATDVTAGFQQVLGVWEQPFGPTGDDWQVPEEEVDDAVIAAFQQYNVWRLYADPPYWDSWIAKWAGQFGADRVVEWRTNRPLQMSAAIRAFQTDLHTAALSHDGNEAMARHIANAHRHELHQRDDQDRPLYYIRKERGDSPNKIDLAMAGVLSWEARNDAVASGAQHTRGPSIYETQDLRVI